ncbi:MAG: hypothetical protein QUU85_07630, partial [Candidatus Eisenbacteria bacterium]|nr:hypothetical protein [Candidatus Eisenbacteria bacterium]
IRTELRTIEGTLRTPAAPASHELRANAAGGFAKPHFLRIDPIRMEGRGEGAGGYEGGYDAGHDAGRESGHDGGQEGRDGEEAERRAA